MIILEILGIAGMPFFQVACCVLAAVGATTFLLSYMLIAAELTGGGTDPLGGLVVTAAVGLVITTLGIFLIVGQVESVDGQSSGHGAGGTPNAGASSVRRLPMGR